MNSTWRDWKCITTRHPFAIITGQEPGLCSRCGYRQSLLTSRRNAHRALARQGSKSGYLTNRENAPKPIVAAVNALHSVEDVNSPLPAISSMPASRPAFGQPEVNGLIPGYGGTQRLTNWSDATAPWN